MVEQEYTMEPFNSTFNEFTSAVVQYGYLALFAPAYPLAPLLALVNNILEMRLDAVKLCTVTRRPHVRQAEDIGSWFTVLNVLGFFAVLTNATMLAFVGSQLGEADEKGGACPENGACPEGFGKAGIAVRITKQRLWVMAMLIEHGVMLMRIFIMRVSPDTPSWISDAKDKLDFRVRGWEEAVDTMRRDGKTTETIHDLLNEIKNRRERMRHQLKASRGVLRTTIGVLPLLSDAGPKKIPKQVIDTHTGVHHDGESFTDKHFWQRHRKTHDGQKVHAKGRADKRSKHAADIARSPRSGSSSPRDEDFSKSTSFSELDTE